MTRKCKINTKKMKKQLKSRLQTDAITFNKSPWGKLSEKIEEVAKPWVMRFSGDPGEPAMDFVYQLTGMIWNACREEQSDVKNKILADVERRMTRVMPDLPEVTRKNLIQELYDRSLLLFPDDPRTVAGIMVKSVSGGYHLSVAGMSIN